MLQAIRDRVTGILAWAIVGLIAITFALWGIDSYLRQDAKVYAARVNDVEIPVQTYRLAFQQQVNRMRELLGPQFRREAVDNDAFRRAVLDRLVEEELIVQAASAAGMRISDGLLAARIHAIKAFQDEDGQFSPDKYKQLLARQGIPPARFEGDMRRSLLISQYMNGITGSAFVSRADVDQALRLQAQTRKVRYLRLPAAAEMLRQTVTPEAVDAYYQAHRDEFMEPEQVRIRYLELKLDDLAGQVAVDEEEIRQAYEAELAKAEGQEQRRARHILIKLDPDADEATVAAARERAQALVEQLRKGADFAELAKAESDDPGSASQGGDLGWFGRGAMVPEFEEAVFALEKGQISDPVRTPFGFHIIQVTDIRRSGAPSYETERERLRQEIARSKAEGRFYELMEQLSETSFETPDTLEAAAAATGLEIRESDWFSRQGGEGIAASPKVVEAAFSEDVLEAGNNSTAIEIEPGHLVVLRVAERKAAQPIPEAAVRTLIETRLKQEQAREAVKATGEKLLERARQGESLEALARVTGHALEDAGRISRGNQSLDRAILRAAFRAPRDAEGKPVVSGVQLADGDYVLIEVSDIQDGDPDQVKKAEREGFARSLAQLRGNEEAQAVVAMLREAAEIEINLDAVR